MLHILCVSSGLLVLILPQRGLSLGAKMEETENLLHCNDCMSIYTQQQSSSFNINK